MCKPILLDEWLLIPVKNQEVLLGREKGSNNYRVTTAVCEIDHAKPPQWAVTQNSTRYYLLDRATTISAAAYAASQDTLVKWGHSPDEAAYYMTLARNMLKEYYAEESRRQNALILSGGKLRRI